MNKEEVAKWIEAVARGLVAKPEDVSVSVKEPDEQGVLFTLKVDQYDAGRIIGKKGAHSNALRTLLNCVGMNNGVRASLKIDVPDKGEPKVY